MQNNIFGFGTLYFLQLIGSAMGTSSAVMFATIYFACHEVKCIQSKHGNNLPYNRRFIDDIIGIWIGNHTDEWEAYQADLNNFGILTWEVGPFSREVDFLDLTLRIEDGRIVSKTFQKPLNLYLYLPPSSSHPLAASRAQSTVLLDGTMPRTPSGMITSISFNNCIDIYSTEDGIIIMLNV